MERSRNNEARSRVFFFPYVFVFATMAFAPLRIPYATGLVRSWFLDFAAFVKGLTFETGAGHTFMRLVEKPVIGSTRLFKSGTLLEMSVVGDLC